MIWRLRLRSRSRHPKPHAEAVVSEPEAFRLSAEISTGRVPSFSSAVEPANGSFGAPGALMHSAKRARTMLRKFIA